MRVARNLRLLAVLMRPAGAAAWARGHCNTWRGNMRHNQNILVTGATGKQGGALAHLLLDRGDTVRVLTRYPNRQAALALQERGAWVVRGSFSDSESIRRAAHKADGVYLISTPYEGPEHEIRAAQTALQAIKEAGAPHVLYSSVAGASELTGVPHFDSKYHIEHYLHDIDLPWAVVAPVFFMENLYSPSMLEDLKVGRIRMPLPADHPLQVVALSDLAQVSDRIFQNWKTYEGQRVEVASTELTGRDLAAVLSAAIGRVIRYEEVSIDDIGGPLAEPMRKMWSWFREQGYQVDIPALHREFPMVDWHDSVRWTQTQDWRVIIS
jgi:uncharacterized protein YbjT (DUF2867 family)